MSATAARVFPVLQRSQSLPEVIADAIQRKIDSGEFAAGGKLPPEAVIAGEFAVSRSVVREAVARLKRDGLVTSRKGSGVYVAQAGSASTFRISPECFGKRRELQQILQLRTSVEADAAALAAGHRSSAQIALLERQLQRLELASRAPRSAESVEEWFDAEAKLYQAIARASGNSFFVDFLQLIDARVRMKLRLAALNNVRVAEMHAAVVAEHRAIVEAIRRKDADAARDAARSHFDRAARRSAARKDLRD